MKSGKTLYTEVLGVFLLNYVKIWNIIKEGSDVRRGRKNGERKDLFYCDADW